MTSIDSGRCPLCDGDNGCAAAAGRDPSGCWCMEAAFPPELLERVPKPLQGQACICDDCRRTAAGEQG
ncbi:cysteine-rich CWC family protein [Paenibacillus albicereus]|uniref:Cysteine-rich CWC family protein n=1 Tax=Paenibacillus albicereus TaxID=2726185 RepID=A0A6H2H1S8_9BACL|nr:cysteine-rich CWC family protein [Paenibacillus albicereus]QJC53643.1 cysteine-rich CWC family protein [Paenibacillus albicereus]